MAGGGTGLADPARAYILTRGIHFDLMTVTYLQRSPGPQPEQGSPDDLAVLLVAIGRQDRAALRRLYDLTCRSLMGVAFRILQDEADAADVLQDVYLKVWQQASRYPHLGNALGWLTVITRNAALDRLKSRERQREDPAGDIEHWLPDTLMPDTEPGLDRCLGRLNAHARQAIVLSYIYGYSHRELEVRLKRPLGTVKAWIRRGLQELKRCLGA